MYIEWLWFSLDSFENYLGRILVLRILFSEKRHEFIGKSLSVNKFKCEFFNSWLYGVFVLRRDM